MCILGLHFPSTDIVLRSDNNPVAKDVLFARVISSPPPLHTYSTTIQIRSFRIQFCVVSGRRFGSVGGFGKAAQHGREVARERSQCRETSAYNAGEKFANPKEELSVRIDFCQT